MDEHAAFLLQLAMLLGLARLLGEGMRRVGQPPVLGELLAGILLGPSLLGWVAPGASGFIFKDTASLDTMSLVGLVLLMLLTGLETDIRVMRNMGRAAFMASFFGIAIPFASGLWLGYGLDEAFLGAGGRLALMLFLATAMGISAMPVIAKILIDLNLVKRDFGILTLSAAVVDDTIGWVVLAVISGLVLTGTFEPHKLAQTMGLLVLFIGVARYGLYPLLRWSLPRADHVLRLPGSELVLIVVVTLLCAAATTAMQVHAVFGAFVAGAVFRQCPALNAENLHRLESVTLSLFAPLFFGAVGLRVDLTALQDFRLPAVVVGIAIAGKVAGCFAGGILGRLPRWTALALGFCMSARGAMGLVVAKIGYDLGILNLELFSALVLMAVVTSFLAPLLLRLILSKVPMNEEERLREKGPAGGFMPSGKLKLLIPVGGGPNALLGCHLAAQLCRSEGDRGTALYVEGARIPWWRKLARRPSHAPGLDPEDYFRKIRDAAGSRAARLTPLRVPPLGTLAETILTEAGRGYHFLILGASGQRHPVYDPFISELVRKAPCHLVVVAGGARPLAQAPPFRRILVPMDGSFFSGAAFELAAAYAVSAETKLSVLHIVESRPRHPLLPAAALAHLGVQMTDLLRVTLHEQLLERFPYPGRLECHVRESESVISGLVEEVHRGSYDLVVLGAEKKSLVERLYLGQHIEAAVAEVPCTVALVIPKIAPGR